MVLTLDGKPAAEAMYDQIRQELHALPKGLPVPCLAAIMVGDSPASQLYIQKKIKACESVGIQSLLLKLEHTVSEKELLELIVKTNKDPNIHGLIVQLPLPDHISEVKVIETIDPIKDVDGFHPYNIGRMTLGLSGLRPATPAGIVALLDYYGVKTEGRHCVVLGRSNIVGTPISILLSKNEKRGNATVTLCHSKTPDPSLYTRQADILIVAVGKPEWIKSDWVKEGAVVIDVGIHRVSSPTAKSGFRVCGDVDFEEVAPKCSFITPVPGGVGLMTVAQLLKNTVHTYMQQQHINPKPINS